MQRYEGYKPSGVYWMGNIPSNWELKKFRYAYTQSNAGDVIDKSHWHFGDELLFTCQRTPMQSGYSKFDDRRRTKSNDLLLTRNGTPYVHLPPEGAIYSNVVQRVRLPDSYNRKFVWYALSNSCQHLSGYGDIIESFNMSTWNNLIFPVPPRPVQDRIVEFLDQKTGEVAAAIAKKERLIELLDEQKSILINSLVTKGINPCVTTKATELKWISETPAHWQIKYLKRLFRETDSRTCTGEEPLLSLRMSGKLIRHNDVSDKPITPNQLIGYKIVNPGQLVMNRMRASLGLFAVAHEQGLVSPDYAVFDCIGDISPDYFLALFRNSAIRGVFLTESKGLGTGSSGFLRLYSDRFGSIKVPCPPYREQEEIVQAINDHFLKFADVERSVESEIEKLAAMRSVLIADVVTGKIRV